MTLTEARAKLEDGRQVVILDHKSLSYEELCKIVPESSIWHSQTSGDAMDWRTRVRRQHSEVPKLLDEIDFDVSKTEEEAVRNWCEFMMGRLFRADWKLYWIIEPHLERFNFTDVGIEACSSDHPDAANFKYWDIRDTHAVVAA